MVVDLVVTVVDGRLEVSSGIHVVVEAFRLPERWPVQTQGGFSGRDLMQFVPISPFLFYPSLFTLLFFSRFKRIGKELTRRNWQGE